MPELRNVAKPVGGKPVPEAEVDREVCETLEMIGLADWSKRRARGITADQKQESVLERLERAGIQGVI